MKDSASVSFNLVKEILFQYIEFEINYSVDLFYSILDSNSEVIKMLGECSYLPKIFINILNKRKSFGENEDIAVLDPNLV